jgi:hypothetical protein
MRQENKEEWGSKILILHWLNEIGINSKRHSWAKKIHVMRFVLAWYYIGTHFACRTLMFFYQQGLLDVIRHNALGDFGALLKEVNRGSASYVCFYLQQSTEQRMLNRSVRMKTFARGSNGNYLRFGPDNYNEKTTGKASGRVLHRLVGPQQAGTENLFSENGQQ